MLPGAGTCTHAEAGGERAQVTVLALRGLANPAAENSFKGAVLGLDVLQRGAAGPPRPPCSALC